jgi:uncharacterized protein (TIGR03067 family)
MKPHVKKTTLAILPLAGWLFAAPVVFGDDLTAERPDMKADQKAGQQELKAKHKAERLEQMAALGIVLLLLGSTGSLSAAAPQGQGTKKELQKFQGAWVMVEGEVEGKKLAEEQVKQSTITFAGNKVKVDSPQLSKDTSISTLTKLDSTKTPKEMYWTRTTGPSAGKPIRAIYEFAGDDQLKICFDPSGKGVPREFAATEETGYILHIWKRAKQ